MIRQLGRASLIRLAFGVLVAVIGVILQHPLAALAVLFVLGLPFTLRYFDQARKRSRARKQELIDYAASLAKQRQFERIAAGTPPVIPLPQAPPQSSAPMPSAQPAPLTPPPSPQAQLQQYDFDFSGAPEAIKTTPEDHLEWQASAPVTPVAVRPRSSPGKKHYFDSDTAFDFTELDPAAENRIDDAKFQESQRIIGARDGYTIVEHLDAAPAQRFALMHNERCVFQGDYAATRAALNAALSAP